MNYASCVADPVRVASGVCEAIHWFDYLGGWNTFGPVCAAFVVFGVLAVWKRRELGALRTNNFYTRWQERRRMNRQQEREFQELAADIITDALEKAHHDNPSEMTFEKKQRLYRLIGKRCGFLDLMRRGEVALKDEIKGRIALTNKDVNGKVAEMPIPGERTQHKEVHSKPIHVHSL